ncbi:MAG TPA: hypothetical protein VGQ53_22005 [Chitinophagaceae bacterium]|jgi:hypothetical protein|nr:hypothetical protein [Chitinophagaceae bacterium]
MFNSQTIDRLMLGINSIISESRSSLSDGEVSLLKECLTFLETVKLMDDPKSPSSIQIVSSVIEILIRVLIAGSFDKLKDIFF